MTIHGIKMTMVEFMGHPIVNPTVHPIVWSLS